MRLGGEKARLAIRCGGDNDETITIDEETTKSSSRAKYAIAKRGRSNHSLCIYTILRGRRRRTIDFCHIIYYIIRTYTTQMRSDTGVASHLTFVE